MNKFFRSAAFYLLIFLVTVGIINFLTAGQQDRQDITYSDLIKYVQQGSVQSMDVTSDGLTLRVQGTLTDGRTFTSRTLFSDQFVQDLNKLATSTGAKIKINPPQKESVWLSFLTSIVPIVLIFVLFFFLFNQAQGGGTRVMNFGKARAKMFTDDKKKVTFNDVAGADEEKAELEEVVEFLKDPRRFSSLGARIPKGILLVGPPGTGKTLLARAVAGEAGVPFFSISGSDFVEMFVGVGASRVRDLFETAKKNAPCIIFIDEIDAVGRHRGAGLGGGHDEREQTLNQLLVEMDGFSGHEGIIIIAATNRPDILDPALLRPGRFDRQITVDRPDVKGREQILKVHARNKPLGPDVSLDVIARRTPGFTGADLENLLNEAALLAARRSKKTINMTEVEDAIDRVIAGPEKRSRVISPVEKKIVAYHEAGHAVVGYFLKNADAVHKVTIIPRGMAGGYTVMLPKEDRYFMTRSEILDRVSGLLGGRVAEQMVLGEISTGAHNDLEKATEIVRRMVTEFGMSDKLGPMQFGHRQGQVFLGRDIAHEQNYSDAIAYEIDKEMRRIIDECYRQTEQVLSEHRDKLELLAQTLLERETVDEDEIKQLMEHGQIIDKKTDVRVTIQPRNPDQEGGGDPASPHEEAPAEENKTPPRQG
ncbi:cell division protein FtsH [Kyrpidia spormannii]|uniref:ATP-dependent zinc metalloprotease FtsH n=1 Tax=Kyrpidia spormannii TaxID=2055160 RepID=A0A2K8N267_9BACL|nr:MULTISPECIES: ATP-dependent zinc metalloprotease FtsH [Kyrpidia]ATY83648.1 cell division protein FtsH [Kyrpidia spormannii]MCL6576392.1 ATP-dependent zinc metalloprotease FtsH [Kyrpidia sp.]CAB3389816.1 ATP-dependent cytoplasmic membrane protease [Kyrpidia spormannii]